MLIHPWNWSKPYSKIMWINRHNTSIPSGLINGFIVLLVVMFYIAGLFRCFWLEPLFGWAGSSAGRAPPSHGGGPGFKSRPVHHSLASSSFLIA